jgi:acyl-CoA thioester hydrolase
MSEKELTAVNIEEGGRLKPYLREVKYYETDQMAVVHHSNYIRWFEEARIDLLDQIGLGFDKIEEAGLYCPVISACCEYRLPVRFKERVLVLPKLTFFNGIKMTLEYRVLEEKSRQLRATGRTEHCFITKDFKMTSLKKNYKQMYEILAGWTGMDLYQI